MDWICSREDEEKAGVLMNSLGFIDMGGSMATRFVRKSRLDVLPVDLLWVNAETFAKMAGTDQRTGLHRDVPVIDLESILAMKIFALKDDAERQS